MLKIGLIKEGKNPPDSRVPMTPAQCVELKEKFANMQIVVESSATRCFRDEEYLSKGVELVHDLSDCDILLGVKEVPVEQLIPEKTYFFFSHTKKKQAYNQGLMHALIDKKIRMIDYEALTYDDGRRVIGFGFFAGVVGAHNGLLTFGKKSGLFDLKPAHACADLQEMTGMYKDLFLPPVKIVLTGSGKVADGMVHIMQALDLQSVASDEFLSRDFEYPVYTVLKGKDLYEHRETKGYVREEFHEFPERYRCKFGRYTDTADILLNGIYWDEQIDRLFEQEDIRKPEFNIQVIADVTCDIGGSVPINLAASTIADPVYGIDRQTLERRPPFQQSRKTIDVMAVDNLPNELPRDASTYFGENILRHILPELLLDRSEMLTRATICDEGTLGPYFGYLADYAYA